MTDIIKEKKEKQNNNNKTTSHDYRSSDTV